MENTLQMTSIKSALNVLNNESEEALIKRLSLLGEQAMEEEDYDMAVGIARYLYLRRQGLLKETK